MPAAAVRNLMEGTRSLVINGELVLYGIIDPWNDGDSVRAVDVMASLVELAGSETIVVRLNSPGGSVVEGFAIYNALRAAGKPIEMHIDALAASIASVIAMAGDEIVMAENASIMIHDPYAYAFGGSEDLRSAADEIDRLKQLIVNIYASRTGIKATEIENLMAAETVLSAAEAVEKGFADKVDETLKVAACATLAAEHLARLISPFPSRATKARASAAPAASPKRTRQMPKPNQAGTDAAIRAEERKRVGTIIAAVAAAHLDSAFADELIEDDEVTLDTLEDRIAAKVAETPPANDQTSIRNSAVRGERERIAGIIAAVRASKLPQDFADDLVRRGLSIDKARAAIIDRLAEDGEEDEGDPAPSRVQNRVMVDGVDKWAQGAQLGLLYRTGMKGGERNEFSGLTLAELARSSLDVRNIKTGAMDRLQMVGTAFTARNAGPGYHSTSDFGNVLSSVAHKALLTGYQEVDETFEQWTGVGTASDFRPINRVDLGLFPNLDKVIESGEYTYATIGDSGVAVQVATYGKMFAISRQAILNDDLDQFSKVPAKMGRAAKRTIGNLVYALLPANPVMQDSLALFHATHGNLASSGAVMSETSLGVARTAMALQKDDAGIATGLGVVPKFLLVPSGLADLAMKLMTAETTPGDAGRPPNVVRSMATIVSDGRLTGTAWYLAGSPSQVDTIEVTYLNGVREPMLEQRQGWSVDGTEFKVRIDAGVKALHWRGLYKNPGA